MSKGFKIYFAQSRSSILLLDEKDDEEPSTPGKLKKQKSIKNSGRYSRVSVVESDSVAAEDESNTEQLPGFGALLRLNKPEWYLIFLACIAAIATSGAMPVFAVFLGEMTKTLAETDTHKMLHDSHLWSLMFLVLGIVIGLGLIVQMAMLAMSGERLTERLRLQVFKSILKQDIEFFDSPSNTTGALTAKLAQDASIIQGYL